MITTAGTYTFELEADGYGQITVNRKSLVRGGRRGQVKKQQSTIELEAGTFPLQVNKYWGKIGSEGVMRLSYSGPDTGGEMIIVPQAVLRK